MRANVDIENIRAQRKYVTSTIAALEQLQKQLLNKLDNMLQWKDQKAQEARRIVLDCVYKLNAIYKSMIELDKHLTEIERSLEEYESINLKGAGNNLGSTRSGILSNARSKRCVQSIDDLSYGEKRFINLYSGNQHYGIINKSCREKDFKAPLIDQLAKQSIHNALCCASLSQDQILYRGTSRSSLGPELSQIPTENLEGMVFTEDGFMSTSTRPEVGRSFAYHYGGEHPMLVTIEARRGENALYIAPISQNSPEEEVLYDYGQSMVITHAEMQGNLLCITVRVNRRG